MRLKGILTLALVLFFKFLCISQTNWSIEDLHVTTFRNGDPLLEVTTESNWKYCNANQIPAYYKLGESLEDGVLYNFYAIKDERQLAPVGYRIPELDDAKAMASDEFFQSSSGGWKTNTGTGYFNADAYGYLPFEGETMELFSKGDAAYYWTITDSKALHSMGFVILNGEKGFSLQEMRRENFCAVRCVKNREERDDFTKSEEITANKEEFVSLRNQKEIKQKLDNLELAIDDLKKRSLELRNVLEQNEEELQKYEADKKLLQDQLDGFKVGRIETLQNNCIAEGNMSVVQIGNQSWMAKNLNVDHFLNGDPILEAKTNDQWEKAGKEGKPAWCYYNYDPANENYYGKLYNWYAVNDSRGLAPNGWHIPSDTEWTVLIENLGGESVAGGKMKTTGTNKWKSPNTEATNSSCFSALPSGGRLSHGTFYAIGNYGIWWSSTELDSAQAWNRFLPYSSATALSSRCSKREGFSVRCIKD
jgi:uncharacterized protein (TIGR02145 family)